MQRRFTAEFTEHAEISSGDPAEPVVGDAVNVDDPGERSPFLVSVQRFSLGDRKTMKTIRAYTLARKNAIIFKISVSLFEVSSNPGVSMRVTDLPSRVNSSAT